MGLIALKELHKNGHDFKDFSDFGDILIISAVVTDQSLVYVENLEQTCCLVVKFSVPSMLSLAKIRGSLWAYFFPKVLFCRVFEFCK